VSFNDDTAFTNGITVLKNYVDVIIAEHQSEHKLTSPYLVWPCASKYEPILTKFWSVLALRSQAYPATVQRLQLPARDPAPLPVAQRTPLPRLWPPSLHCGQGVATILGAFAHPYPLPVSC